MDNLDLPSRFKVRALLGEGGSGRVYRVLDRARDRELALKVVSASDIEFLRREFDVLHQIRHENLVQVFDWGVLPSDRAYYTMELIVGEDWGRRAGSEQPASEVRRILTGLLRGLAHLHCHSEIHGDLKPANILLGAGGLVKVTDVGMGANSPQSGMAGTPGYTAPECWEGRTPDIRSDLYSVGVMAYEALTGRHPFAGRTIRDVVAGQLEGWVPSPAAHRVRVPPDLERVVMRSLERAASLRQGSCDEFMDGLGVTDRVGLILGGKFIDSGELIPQVFSRARRKRVDDPTLILISGAPGVGKTEALEQLELAYVRDGMRCIRVVSGGRTSFRNTVASELGAGESSGNSIESSLFKLAELVRVAATAQPVVIMLDGINDGLQSDALESRTLAQHLFAASFEHGIPIQATIILAQRAESDPEVYSTRVQISELDEPSSLALVEGFLGCTHIPAGGLHALHLASGGNPSSLHALLFDLRSTGRLERIEGVWKLAEVGRLGEGASPTLESRWRERWENLPPMYQDVLGAVALTSGIETDDVSAFEDSFAEGGAVARLRSTGWLKWVSHRVRFSSEGLRGIVLGLLTPARKRDLAVRLLQNEGVAKGPMGIALRLLAHPTREVVLEAVGVATAAMASQDLPRAMDLLSECKKHELLLPNPNDRASVHITFAEALMEAGEISQAEARLREQSVTAINSQEGAARAKVHLLLGTIAGRVGRLSEARSELNLAIENSRDGSDTAVYLRALAAFGELAWTHGDDQERHEAIRLVESALEEAVALQGYEEERGQLVYGLGSAHIRTGQLEKAVRILESEFPRITSSYWGARIANALGTVCFYLGRADESMSYFARGMELLADGAAPDTRARIHANRGACLNAMGRLREALDENERALTWSRRAGSGYDTIAAAAGIAVDLFYLGRFDAAIAKAREVRELATRIANVVYQFKGLELEGFSALAIGDLENVERLLSMADQLPQNFEPGRTRPRLEILRARLAIAHGNRADAIRSLHLARELLRSESDLEDLWWVEIELAALDEPKGTVTATLATLAAIALKSNEAKMLVVEIQAGVSIAQILFNDGKADADLIGLLTAILGRAEESGFIDDAWRINLGLGIALMDAGDARAGQTRLIQAQRLLVQIADGLSPESRRMFVRASHVAPALEVIARRIASASTM